MTWLNIARLAFVWGGGLIAIAVFEYLTPPSSEHLIVTLWAGIFLAVFGVCLAIIFRKRN